MRSCLFIFIALVLYTTACSQVEGSFEQYHTIGARQQYTWMPVVHIQNNRQWYAEARYNYEEAKTVSLYLGKTFSGERKFAYSFTPLVGGAVGKFTGISTGLNMDMEYEKFSFSAQSQLTMSLNERNGGFVYNWSELSYQALRWLYTGISLQQTYTNSYSKLDRAVLVGFTFNKCTIPVYAFDVFNKERYFIVGVILNWNSTGKKHNPVVLPFVSDAD